MALLSLRFAVLLLFVLLTTTTKTTQAFQCPATRTIHWQHNNNNDKYLVRKKNAPLYAFNLPNPFFAREDDATDSSTTLDEFEETAAGLIRQARRVISSDFGIMDASLLADEDFIWVGPFLDQPLSKTEYLAAGRFFDLRAAFPDLDYRAHDFRIIDGERTVRFSCRTTGTLRGALRLRSGTLPPTGKTMKCPPEAVTIAFDRKGQVTKLCTGFCMDRQVGNTAGATGVMAAAMVAGQPPSDWDLYPAPAVIARFFGRPVPALKEVKAVLAPFPETVMIQLTKGILATNMAAGDPTLLADNFMYSTPYQGPVRKEVYLEKFAAQEFENLDPTFNHFRVDPFDPFRVWVDVSPAGVGYQGAPQAMSFTFDDDGFCTRITSAYVMDPSVGNGGGLGGREGYLYATDRASLPLLTRPWSRVVGRIRKKLLSPLTGVDVDEYKAVGSSKKKTPVVVRRPAAAPPKDSVLPASVAETLSSMKAPLPKTLAPPSTPPPSPVTKPKPPPPKARAVINPPPPKKNDTTAATDQRAKRRQELQEQKKKAAADKAALAARKTKQAAEAKAKQEAAAAAAKEAKMKKLESQRSSAAQKLKEAEERRSAVAKAAAEKKAQAEARRKELADEKKRMAEQRKAQSLRAKQEQEQASKKAAEGRKAKAASEASAKQAAAVNKKAAEEAAQNAAASKQAAIEAAAARRERQKAALDAISNAVSRATVSLFGLGGGGSRDVVEDSLPPARKTPSTKKAPPGVPTIARWKKNSDGSITGLVRGSRNFSDGDKITTSPIANGTIESGQVVRTGSGSRYFLD